MKSLGIPRLRISTSTKIYVWALAWCVGVNLGQYNSKMGQSFFWKFIVLIKYGLLWSGIKWWISQEFQILETKFDNFRVSNFGPISLTFPFYSEFLYRITTELKRARYQNIKFSCSFMQFHIKYVYIIYKYDTKCVFW